ncbi:6065_t:CDS:2 [Diversispora eburnea]|uniref:6065_t:CDS:1 n=1 Tax=Diversispora eburnea TaxID=1213867 RepID=A0A9N8YLV0_9GLOM|nr:6065_t:CDS:2 [Diversispora eburnea]
MVAFVKLKVQESTYISTVKKLEAESQGLQQKLKFSLENTASQSSSTRDKQIQTKTSKPDLPEPVSGKKHSHDDDREMVSKARRIKKNNI